jgi:hypothetical protein
MLEQPMIEKLLSMRCRVWRMLSKHRNRTPVSEN